MYKARWSVLTYFFLPNCFIFKTWDSAKFLRLGLKWILCKLALSGRK